MAARGALDSIAIDGLAVSSGSRCDAYLAPSVMKNCIVGVCEGACVGTAEVRDGDLEIWTEMTTRSRDRQRLIEPNEDY